jgi:hypothetical protein
MAYTFQEYPKWVDDKLVANAEEEAKLAPKPVATPAETVVVADPQGPTIAIDPPIRRGPGRPPMVK